mmetsp:Transcript_7068/g.14506  ORF Transcript_7068/g.14506 Transcript_7068/m.14506 type:complete len:155 (+) Transcript_7068:174-638(+)
MHHSEPFRSLFTEFWRLSELFKSVSLEVVNRGGIIRGIHNHGIRQAPHRFKAKFADAMGRRYYEKVRFISVYMDCNPQTRQQVQQLLASDENVLRQTHLKARSILDQASELSWRKNPFLKEVLEEIKAEEEEAQGATAKEGQEEEEEEDIVSVF